MTEQTKPSIDELVGRAADLKGELVAFAESPRFARRLDAILFNAVDQHWQLDEMRAVQAIDYFALQHRLSDGRTVLERFVAQRRPALLQEAWETQASHRADFVDQVGADMTVLPPPEAQETLREHYRRQQQRALAGLDAKAAKRAAKKPSRTLAPCPRICSKPTASR